MTMSRWQQWLRQKSAYLWQDDLRATYEKGYADGRLDMAEEQRDQRATALEAAVRAAYAQAYQDMADQLGLTRVPDTLLPVRPAEIDYTRPPANVYLSSDPDSGQIRSYIVRLLTDRYHYQVFPASPANPIQALVWAVQYRNQLLGDESLVTTSTFLGVDPSRWFPTVSGDLLSSPLHALSQLPLRYRLISKALGTLGVLNRTVRDLCLVTPAELLRLSGFSVASLDRLQTGLSHYHLQLYDLHLYGSPHWPPATEERQRYIDVS